MTHRTATPLTSFEAAVLAKLLDGAHPALGALRAQMRGAMARSRKFSGAGFFIDLAIPEDLPRAPVQKHKIHFGDVAAEIPSLKHGAGFVLFVEDGRLSMLEGYSYDEPWHGEPERFELRYLDPQRSSVIQALEAR
jgi:hypothetical protein